MDIGASDHFLVWLELGRTTKINVLRKDQEMAFR